MTPNEGPTNSSGAKFMEQKMFLSVNYICLIISDVYGLLVLEFIAFAYLLSDCCSNYYFLTFIVLFFGSLVPRHIHNRELL